MLIYGPAASFCVRTSFYCVSSNRNSDNIPSKSSSNLTRYSRRCNLVASFLAAAAVIVSAAGAVEVHQDSETLSNIPQILFGECASAKDCKKPRIQRPKSRKAESCTTKCVTTCIRGGDGSPGEGPLNIRRPLVVFKEGFRSRKYCLVECSDICNLIGDGDDGP
ncbi:uncharacterized protein LOC111274354 isoform X2 [Durio zibethinus]|uniref:Uncharacterized protein LOC111274354 isoform X2 n=1 Tax=Durio zibethinus TaxID=66656 RepID=A0A6P5WGZ2_DURZI|nr:uncharacterized protein LOC111274354 isoform X2 [Durio zibethinus]